MTYFIVISTIIGLMLFSSLVSEVAGCRKALESYAKQEEA